jgi:hypothetical protein
MQYLVSGSNHVRIHGTEGRKRERKTGATAASTFLFGPTALIQRGKMWTSDRNRTCGLHASGHLARADQLTGRSVRARLIASRAASSATESVTKMSE